MTKPVSEYLDHARIFERLALLEQRIEARKLLSAQADTCYRLAARRARETNAPIPMRPVGPCLITGHGAAFIIGNEAPGKRD